MSSKESGLIELVEGCCIPQVTPHAYNLLHQIKHAKKDTLPVLKTIVPEFLKFAKAASAVDSENLHAHIPKAVVALERYLALLRVKENDKFVSQSDFKTSVIPDFFLRIFHKYIETNKLPFAASGQTDLAIEIAFDLKRPGVIVPRMQRVDIAVVKKIKLTADDTQLAGFCIPLFAAEAKTYFDKNMVSGVDYSVASMKSTFPHCLYYAIGEFADFDLAAHSYASSEIDEIFILRKQKRSAWRKSNDANKIDAELVEEIIKNVFASIVSQQSVHKDLTLRVPNGRLILGNPALK
ncbi:Bpu10I family restriction endonuclease [Bradyrhizobium sp. TM239]|uniref:Bpu10I family restriction endonuclease n=1 Tax=Bradyrhizobium sp. TM239 TaxID=2599802 RepID=UPI0027D51F4C|nr:hypothetical protein TM239_05060 [Bradyrhizobium sp. TM239]